MFVDYLMLIIILKDIYILIKDIIQSNTGCFQDSLLEYI